MSQRNIRILISSPGDVQEERNKAKAVVEQLRRTFAGRLQLSAIFWEELSLQATMSFQEGIDLLLSQKGVDVAVFILWSRLGSPTVPLLDGEHPRQFRSGTEREWHMVLRAREQCEKQGMTPRPDIFVYVRSDDSSFDDRLLGKPTAEKDQLIQQRKDLDNFISEHFQDSQTGVNVRAYHSFNHPTTFSQRLRKHLTDHFEGICGDTKPVLVWAPGDKGSPYRGLEVFDYEHSPIFFGRETETVAICDQLKQQAEGEFAFLLITGPSGSGKSSLARAGVLPYICERDPIQDYCRWRWLAVRPSELGEDMLAGLLQKLCSEAGLPELRKWAGDIEIPADRSDLREWLARVGIRVKDALAASGATESRLVLLVDQLEEFFSRNPGHSRDAAHSSRSHTPDSSRGFFELLEALARLRVVWVVATVRSDFYQECQAVPSLVRMKAGLGHFDLLPPGPDDLQRVITGPAVLAGLRFEQQEGQQQGQQQGKSLADLVLRECAGQAELLPLVEHLLRDLYDHRSADGMLTLKRYDAVQGLAGALRAHCEKTHGDLSGETQAAFTRVFSQLVSISGDNLDTAIRRTIFLSTFDADPPAAELVKKLVEARLLTTGADLQGRALVSVSHEAVLRSWPRVAKWFEDNREYLRIRRRLELAESRWREQSDDSLLLQRGIPLQEARRLLDSAPQLLSPETRGYVDRSLAFDAAKTARQRRVFAIALSLLVCIVSTATWWMQRSLTESRVRGLVASLDTAEPNNVVEIIEELRKYPELKASFLQSRLAADAKTARQRQSLLNARLAMVADDASLVEPLVGELLNGKITNFSVVRQQLSPRKSDLVEQLKRLIRDETEESRRRFRAAMVLADWLTESEAEYWIEADLKFVAKQLVSENAEFQQLVRDALRPIRQRLLPALEDIFTASGEDGLGDNERLSAANAFADFAQDDTMTLARLLVDATPQQHRVLFPLVAANKSDDVIALHEGIAASLPPEDMGSAQRVPFGQRRANAAATLLLLGERAKVLPVFQMTDDPEALAQFIFRCRPRGVGVEALLDCLEIVSAAPPGRYAKGSRYALLLALAEFQLSEVPENRRAAVLKQVRDWYATDPSSGVHGASNWLLRQWGEGAYVKQIDETPMAPSTDREWFTLALKVKPEAPSSPQDNSLGSESATPITFYYTFVVFPAGEYTLGSPEDELPKRDQDEVLHRVRLTRPFAILNREVTFAELIAFNPERYKDVMKKMPLLLLRPESTGAAVSWYDAVRFSRWLGTQDVRGWLGAEGALSESEQAYADPASPMSGARDPNRSAEGAPQNWPLDVSRRGFRLPSEAEWEISSRGGVRSSYGFGSDVSLLDGYEWYQENSGGRMHLPMERRPSHRGLFDMHGNAAEWVHDWYGGYRGPSSTDPLGAEGGSSRVFRGGCWSFGAAGCRSALRFRLDPTFRWDIGGFRLALSFVGVPAESGQDKNK